MGFVVVVGWGGCLFVLTVTNNTLTKTAYLSGTLGAKQDVVECTQRIFSAPRALILASTALRSVRSSSPSNTFSITTGSKPDQKKQELNITQQVSD